MRTRAYQQNPAMGAGPIESTRTRNDTLDICRGVAILIVIVGHALQIANGGVGNPLHNFILTFQMEVFFIISGYAAAYSSQKDLLPAVKAHFLRLAVPYMFWVFVLALITAVAKVNYAVLTSYPRQLIGSGFWFLKDLFLVLVVFDVYRYLQKLLCSRFLPFLVAAVLCLCFSVIPGQCAESSLLHYSVFFILGYVLNPGRVQFTNQSNENLLVKALKWCGLNSLALYAVHWNLCFICLHNRIIDFHALVAHGWCIYFVSVSVAALWLLLCVPFIVLVKKVPILSALMFGDRMVLLRGSGTQRLSENTRIG